MNDREYALQWLRENTPLTAESIAGICGNLQAESGCEACRLQGDFSADRSASRAYAAQADGGALTREAFSKDGKGWGYYQLTYWSRKQAFWDFCREKGRSVADREGQLTFLVKELQQDFPGLWRKLLACTDLQEATRLVLTEFERPAVLNLEARLQAARSFYTELCGGAGKSRIAEAVELLERAIAILKEECP